MSKSIQANICGFIQELLNQPYVEVTLPKLHANYVLIPADKVANNAIVVCKKYYIKTIVKELAISNVNSNNAKHITKDD